MSTAVVVIDKKNPEKQTNKLSSAVRFLHYT